MDNAKEGHRGVQWGKGGEEEGEIRWLHHVETEAIVKTGFLSD